jgi:hypothetical protein
VWHPCFPSARLSWTAIADQGSQAGMVGASTIREFAR